MKVLFENSSQSLQDHTGIRLVKTSPWGVAAAEFEPLRPS